MTLNPRNVRSINEGEEKKTEVRYAGEEVALVTNVDFDKVAKAFEKTEPIYWAEKLRRFDDRKANPGQKRNSRAANEFAASIAWQAVAVGGIAPTEAEAMVRLWLDHRAQSGLRDAGDKESIRG